MFPLSNYSAQDCRYAKHPGCEPTRDANQAAKPTALGVFQIGKNDVLDFGIDFTDWLAANFAPKITAVVWSVTADSPKTPAAISAGTFDPDSKASVVLTPDALAVGGDFYILEAEVTLGPVAAQAGVPPISVRKIVRRIHVQVVNG